jgi:hypothetical protein
VGRFTIESLHLLDVRQLKLLSKTAFSGSAAAMRFCLRVVFMAVGFLFFGLV